ncbi:MAG: 4-alpha-glucanotransferase [Lachnospiraceae bacterium]|nr:4-alpha-glucanotransferase [Lachnospiraceae bacterium]
MRRAGILMSVSSLPSEYGIGCFSKEAYDFVDMLKEAGQSIWQILPLGPTSYGDSPYQSFSTFAGNPYFIDPKKLIAKGYISKKECDSYDFGNDPEKVDYEKIYKSRFKLLKKAFKNFDQTDKAFTVFVKNNSAWLEDYALYMAIKASFDSVSWQDWDDDIRLREEGALKKYREKYKDEVKFYEFIQYEFYEEWSELKSYAHSKGISIVGDIPIYVALDSSDCWANPELFQFDEDLRPIAVAGCPPDAFAATGQLWGNPLYKWELHKKQNYSWWMERLKNCFELYDIVRIDHFRGFDEYYSIPFPAENAVNGSWEAGPGYELFKVMKEKLGKQNVIAEDLGFLTPSVIRMVKKSGYPGMKILQFAFDSREDSDYLPHNYSSNSVVYTGTHDNDTTLSWYLSLPARDKKCADDYLDIPKAVKKNDIPWYFIRAAYSSVSDLAVIPMQDILSLPGKARMNYPSTLGGNWEWRMKPLAFTKARQKRLLKLTKTYRRLPQ